MSRAIPSIDQLLHEVRRSTKPIAFVLAGHNGSGKSTLWYQKLAPTLKIPLVNADRLMLSILPEPEDGLIPPWAQRLRDDDERWQKLAQEGVRVFKQLVMNGRMPFAFETVFSHWKLLPNGEHQSKIDDIKAMQEAGYFVVLLFVGLTNVDMSILRVSTRKEMGGHDVAVKKLRERFPRTQKAIGEASKVADMSLMFDNSRGFAHAFTLVRAQKKSRLIYDARAPQYGTDPELLQVSSDWLEKVVGTELPKKLPASILN
ncbi:zeta toxin family protein [Pigmentiphaga sp.]|uniref:zeta toxin family protein n=1 Tax=Pigmentiphaga sp. TaxID=1977564 RepID=UPI0025FCA1A7|nr:zeta toxin family protein [Pigmentiphaga sp.]